MEVEISWLVVDGTGWRWMEVGARFSNSEIFNILFSYEDENISRFSNLH